MRIFFSLLVITMKSVLYVHLYPGSVGLHADVPALMASDAYAVRTTLLRYYDIGLVHIE